MFDNHAVSGIARLGGLRIRGQSHLDQGAGMGIRGQSPLESLGRLLDLLGSLIIPWGVLLSISGLVWIDPVQHL